MLWILGLVLIIFGCPSSKSEDKNFINIVIPNNEIMIVNEVKVENNRAFQELSNQVDSLIYKGIEAEDIEIRIRIHPEVKVVTISDFQVEMRELPIRNYLYLDWGEEI